MPKHLNELKKAVTFIFRNDSTGKIHPLGTGFFIGVKNPGKSNEFYLYLATAKHVIQDENGLFLPKILIRLNKKDGGSEYFEIPLIDINIFEHEDKDVDLALFNIVPNQNYFDFKLIQDDLIATNEIIDKHNISEGDDVFFCGLFSSHIGQKKNQPIIRFGKISLMSDEKIEWKEEGKPLKYMDLYLLECQSFGGNSGSPVFFQMSLTREPGMISFGGQSMFLGGIMTGSFLNANNVLITSALPNLLSLQNVGIAAVTPAQKLYDILFSDKLVQIRNER